MSWLGGESISSEARDIISRFLCSDPHLRLGSSTTGGVQAVKGHPVFSGLDWERVLKQKVEFVISLHGKGLEDSIYVDSKFRAWSGVKLYCLFVFANIVLFDCVHSSL